MDPGSGNVIMLDGVKKRFGKAWAVQNVSIHVPRASVFGLAGPAGAGKTTVLRLIAGLERTDDGTVRVDGFDAWQERSILHYRLAYMPQEFGRYPHLTVEEYLAFFEASFDVPVSRRPQLTDELLELVELNDRRQEPVGRLSADEQKWLSLSRCLIHDPDILLLDDPTRQMTAIGTSTLGEMLTEMSNLGKTVVITSRHSLEIAEICTHMRVIRDGTVLEEGAVDAVTAQ